MDPRSNPIRSGFFRTGMGPDPNLIRYISIFALPSLIFGITLVVRLTDSQRAAIHAKHITIKPEDSRFVRNMWNTIDPDCAIGGIDEASARIIGTSVGNGLARSGFKLTPGRAF